ncbi:hypothetical protein LMB83_11110 [Limosilactobacillus reuteri]|uniref:hypothetical protein n=1 Tax=Limosilactobacillus reuteri TaxID=1598 RepID=UPI001E631C82|nr:hypothetical protein [Limosilactobacillus reuteri]MCC4412370.1 hypothetical protein [Limosilactobacillus reuteri]MCC4412576.1 hypothetical protein [Limosilactobacillus reuteri]
MSEFKLPHVDDLTTNSKLPGQLTENFKVTENVIKDIEGRLEILEKKNKQDSDFDNHLYD